MVTAMRWAQRIISGNGQEIKVERNHDVFRSNELKFKKKNAIGCRFEPVIGNEICHKTRFDDILIRPTRPSVI